MDNLLKETLNAIAQAKKAESDVLWVGSRDGVFELSKHLSVLRKVTESVTFVTFGRI